MADEIAQVCELEIRGITLVVKGTVEAAQMVLRMMRALINYSEKISEKYKEKVLQDPGRKEIHEIMKLSEGGPASVLEIRSTMLEEVIQIASKKGMHFAMLTDFNPNDGKTPIFVPAQETAIWGAILKTVAERTIVEDEKVVAGYRTQIAEEKEKLLHAKPEEREHIETRIENFTQAQEEAQRWVDYDESIINADDVTMSFQEYLKQAKGTDFETNPEKAMAEMEKGVEIGKKFTAKECLQPIRDKGFIPDTKIMFYVPDMGATITRSFKVDADTGLVYSDYALKTKDGEIHRFSDHNMTREKWNTNTLPQLLDKAQLLEESECRAFDSKEKLEAYLTYHNNVKPQSQIDLEKDLKEGKQVFSNAETKNEIEHAISEKMKGLASARIINNRVELRVEPNAITRQNGKLMLGLNTGETLLFNGMTNERIEGGKMVFEIERDAQVLHLKYKGDSFDQAIPVTGQECKEIIANATEQINTITRSMKNSK